MEEYKEIEKKSCNALHYTTYTTQEKKSQIQIRMRKSYHKTFMNYCRMADMSVDEFYTSAGTLYMELNPVDGNVFIVEKPQRNNKKDIQSEIQEFICLEDMREFVMRLKKDSPDNTHLLRARRQNFIELLKDCNKVKIWGDELSALIMQAKTHFE